MNAAWEEVLSVSWDRIGKPIANCCSRLFGDLELDRPARFPLDYRGSVLHPVPDAHVAYPQPHEVAAPQLAIDGEIEQSKVASALFKLEPDADCPDLPRSQRTFLINEAALVPGHFGKADERWDRGLRGCLLDPARTLRSRSSADPQRDDLRKAAPTKESRPPAHPLMSAGPAPLRTFAMLARVPVNAGHQRCTKEDAALVESLC